MFTSLFRQFKETADGSYILQFSAPGFSQEDISLTEESTTRYNTVLRLKGDNSDRARGIIPKRKFDISFSVPVSMYADHAQIDDGVITVFFKKETLVESDVREIPISS